MEVKIEMKVDSVGDACFDVYARHEGAIYQLLAENIYSGTVAAVVGGICDRLCRGELVSRERAIYRNGGENELNLLQLGNAAEDFYGDSSACVPSDYYLSGFFLENLRALKRREK